jgi:predicted ABC-type sugar transport system permease subunit
MTRDHGVGIASRKSGSMGRIAIEAFRNTSVIVLMLMVLVCGVFRPDFLKYANIESIAVNASSAGVLAGGITFVFVTGGPEKAKQAASRRH